MSMSDAEREALIDYELWCEFCGIKVMAHTHKEAQRCLAGIASFKPGPTEYLANIVRRVVVDGMARIEGNELVITSTVLRMSSAQREAVEAIYMNDT